MATPEADLTDRNARIRELAAGGVPHSAIALRFGLDRSRVTQIVNAPAAAIGDLASARRVAAAKLERLRRQKRELEAEIAIVAAFVHEIDDELLVRTNDRILGLS